MKIIKDIRIYKSDIDNIDNNSHPIGFADKALNAITSRIVMKLRENNFSLGEFDHLYINFTTSSVMGEIALSTRSIDKYHPWFRYYDVNVSADMFSRLESPEIQDEIIKLIEKVLIQYFATESFDETLICSCIRQAIEQGEHMLMKFKEKVTAKRRAIIFLRYLDTCKYFPLLRIYDAMGNLLLEKDLPKTLTPDSLGSIQLSTKKVTIKPKNNIFAANIEPIVIEY